MSTDELLAAGKAALTRGNWQAAREAFEQASGLAPTPEALEALGMACWWQDDQQPVIDAREAAYRLYRERGDVHSAARVATALGIDYADYRGELAVSMGWLARAENLLKGVDLSVEHGWLHVYHGIGDLMFYNDLPEARRRLDILSEIVPEIGSVDVEMMATALRGLTLIREGAIAEGMRCLDEAMTAALGGDVSDLAAVGTMYCALIYACEALADYDRANQWCERALEFSRRLGVELFFAICRNYHATVLIWKGEWDEADSELSAALKFLQTRRPSYALESLAKLGELRRRQGRIDDAKDIFARAEPHRTAVFGRAALALDAGDARTAIDLLSRLLRRIGEEDLAERVFVLELLARAHLQTGAVDAAEALLPAMQALAADIGTPAMTATLKATQGLTSLHREDLDGARRCFEDAIDLFLAGDAGFDAARVRLDYVEALEREGRYAFAVEQAMLAQAAFAQLGAGLYRERTAQIVARLSRGLGAPPSFASLPHGLTPREAEVLWLIAAGKTNQDIARELVLSVRTVERHISTVYEKLGLHGRAARASAASIAAGLQANT